ncbi:hypothetical protein [Aureliella helgolandensis]|uniref:Uncharacterized protein n=1 Tax=Aureliella helgolandensis TaxID=2527968 RepID=A0A518G8B1_9BACT|nr:hypothetical protein [Aureliella helgolandensis]QDV24824.1 hypothetical protein Q31a_31460 [Aureliella helgolandensis]
MRRELIRIRQSAEVGCHFALGTHKADHVARRTSKRAIAATLTSHLKRLGWSGIACGLLLTAPQAAVAQQGSESLLNRAGRYLGAGYSFQGYQIGQAGNAGRLMRRGNQNQYPSQALLFPYEQSYQPHSPQPIAAVGGFQSTYPGTHEIPSLPEVPDEYSNQPIGETIAPPIPLSILPPQAGSPQPAAPQPESPIYLEPQPLPEVPQSETPASSSDLLNGPADELPVPSPSDARLESSPIIPPWLSSYLMEQSGSLPPVDGSSDPLGVEDTAAATLNHRSLPSSQPMAEIPTAPLAADPFLLERDNEWPLADPKLDQGPETYIDSQQLPVDSNLQLPTTNDVSMETAVEAWTHPVFGPSGFPRNQPRLNRYLQAQTPVVWR